MFYQIGINATKLFKTPIWGQTLGIEIASGSSQSSGEERPPLSHVNMRDSEPSQE